MKQNNHSFTFLLIFTVYEVQSSDFWSVSDFLRACLSDVQSFSSTRQRRRRIVNESLNIDPFESRADKLCFSEVSVRNDLAGIDANGYRDMFKFVNPRPSRGTIASENAQKKLSLYQIISAAKEEDARYFIEKRSRTDNSVYEREFVVYSTLQDASEALFCICNEERQ